MVSSDSSGVFLIKTISDVDVTVHKKNVYLEGAYWLTEKKTRTDPKPVSNIYTRLVFKYRHLIILELNKLKNCNLNFIVNLCLKKNHNNK